MRRLFALFLLLAGACSSQPPSESILSRSERVRSDVYWLADDAREGRLPGTQGADDTAKLIEDRFRRFGLVSVSTSKSYQQTFTIPRTRSIAPDTTLESARLNIDYTPLNFSGSNSFTGQLVFAGYGVKSEKYQYDDFANLDIKGKVVIAMRYEPHDLEGKSRFTHGDFTGSAAMLAKVDIVHKLGGVALLLVNPPNYHADDAPLRKFESFIAMPGTTPIPIISISPQYAQTLIGDLDLKAIQTQIDLMAEPQSRLIGKNIAGKINLKTTSIKASNVIGVLPGIGANKDEYVVVGAHYDHLGHGQIGSRKPGSDQIHNGADDNASGIAAMLDVARNLSNHRLNRSVIFIAFTGEESGLLGSRYFVDHLDIKPEKIRAMINLDMVGRVRNNSFFVGGVGTNPSFSKLLTDSLQNLPLKTQSIGLGGMGPSDHQSFALRKIPVLFFFTGMHDQYHSPEDDSNLINFEGILSISQLTSQVVQSLATSPREPYDGQYDDQPMKTDINPDHPATQISEKPH